jgi:hypothetical protein
MKLTPGRSKLFPNINDWYALDIGFSSEQKSCGVYRTDADKPSRLPYGYVANDLVRFATGRERIGLIIEAPLSCSFNSNGNPCGRSFEKQGAKTRYWFTGLGCAVMSAALFLLHGLHQNHVEQEIVLFEGFVSFKGKRTRHEDDARTLFQKRNTVRDAEQIRSVDTSQLFGITSIFGGPSEAPGVIVCEQ